MAALRVLIADDERPARKFLANLLAAMPDVELVAEASNGREAVALIEQLRPDLALLDLQMPELGGLDAARLVSAGATPAIAFVTAFDEFAVQAFELNAVDYLLKPVDKERLTITVERARARVKAGSAERIRSIGAAAAAYETATRRSFLERLPVRRRDEVFILPVRQIASIVADGELLLITTVTSERYTLTHPLHALEAKLDPRRFVRLGRGTLAALDLIQKVSPMPGGSYEVTLTNGQQLPVSRLQSKVLRETLLKL
ncbi:MAG: response regulator [Acidobacteria bacterium]|nr:response regulator [Acidobacteriota bacterium]